MPKAKETGLRGRSGGSSQDETSATPVRTSLSGGGAGFLAAAAVAGAAVGIAASFGRKFLVSAPALVADDWVEALKAEHQAILAIFDEIEATSDTQAATRSVLLWKLKYVLDIHASQEENVIYPALRAGDSAGDADALHSEHGYFKTCLYELDTSPKDSPEWLARVRDFRSVIEAHVRIEEDEIFPQFRQALTEEQNARLTAMMTREGLKFNPGSLPVRGDLRRRVVGPASAEDPPLIPSDPQEARSGSDPLQARVESSVIAGKGIGPLVGLDAGQAELDNMATADLSTDWARSKLLGAAEMASELGISPATLANWRREGRVIAFKRDRRNYHYPERQIYRGTVIEGLSAVVRHFDRVEDAWEWLVTPNVHTRGLAPIDRLRRGAQDEVERAAEGALDFA